MRNISSKFVILSYQRPFIYSAIYHGSYMFGVCSKTRRCYALKLQRNMCICVYKNIINKQFILYKYFVVYYITCYTIFYYFI